MIWNLGIKSMTFTIKNRNKRWHGTPCIWGLNYQILDLLFLLTIWSAQFLKPFEFISYLKVICAQSWGPIEPIWDLRSPKRSSQQAHSWIRMKKTPCILYYVYLLLQTTSQRVWSILWPIPFQSISSILPRQIICLVKNPIRKSCEFNVFMKGHIKVKSCHCGTLPEQEF